MLWSHTLVLQVFIPIPSALDEQKLLSSLNTLGYIEFDTLGALSSLEKKFRSVELSLLANIIVKESIGCIAFTFIQI
jgi:hypothetical protein